MAGDTVGGKVNIRGISAPTIGMITNRAYFDLHAFYVPFRLLDDQFVPFLTQSEAATLPSVTGQFLQNYEMNAGAHNPYLRYAYNMVYNKFFRMDQEAERAIDDVGLGSVKYRPSTLHESEPEGPVVSTTIDTSGTELDVNDIRQAFNQDNFRKIREYYGERYVDFLRALGVTTNWAIQEEPEMVGQNRGTFKYNIVDPTAADTTGVESDYPVGKPGGYFTYNGSLRLRRTFCPEHGVICIYASTKLEQHYTTTDHPMNFNSRSQGDSFWSPEYDTVQNLVYDRRLWFGGVEATPAIDLPRWEHLRKSVNLSVKETADTSLYSHTVTPTDFPDFKQTDGPAADEIFQDIIGSVAGSPAQIVFTADHQLQKLSPVGKRIGAPVR